jgi:electron transfer flavoprotein beta subunit
MKVIVAVKRVIDPYVKIRISPSQREVETQHVKHVMNPFDEIALEEAIRLFEKKIATEVIAVSIGSDASQETLRHALALGATSAQLIKTDQPLCSLNIAKILAHLVSVEQPTLVLLGKQAIDDDSNQTAQMLAALLSWPQATFASAITVDGSLVQVMRETDTGTENLILKTPAIVSVDLRLNEPRYASLPNIMKAKQKPLNITALDSLQLNLKEHTKLVSIKPPPVRQSGIKVDSIGTLIEKLKNVEKII